MKAENDPVLVSKSFRVGYSPWAHKESDRTERPPQPVASQVALVVKNLPVMEETYLGLIPGLGRSPGGGHGNPLQYSYLENPHGQRSLVGYSPWGCKESSTTERLSTAQHFGNFSVRTGSGKGQTYILETIR